MLSEWAARKKLAIANNPQTTATGKRKRDDSEVTEPPRAPEKKPKVAQVTAPPLRSANIDIVSPKIPVAWPAFRQSPIIFGQPKLSSIIAGRSSTVRPPSIAATSTPAPNLPSTVSALLSGPQRASFAKFASDQPKRRVQEEPACDEHFTFADRRRSHPQPTSRSGAAHQHSKTAQNTSSNQPPPISSVKSQAADGWQPISTIYKPPFAGVDMSSLRIPANSNVTMNFFHAPSVLHQNAESDGPRKLKCIQCKEVYMEARNTAMECRRHTGTGPVSSCPLIPAGRQRANSLLILFCRSLRQRRQEEFRPS